MLGFFAYFCRSHLARFNDAFVYRPVGVLSRIRWLRFLRDAVFTFFAGFAVWQLNSLRCNGSAQLSLPRWRHLCLLGDLHESGFNGGIETLDRRRRPGIAVP